MPRRNFILLVFSLLLSACAGNGDPNAARPDHEDEPPTSAAVSLPVPTTQPAPASPTPLSTPPASATPAVFNPLAPPRPDEVSVEHITSFALLPDNKALGQTAPDFSARLMGGGTFTLSEQRGRYWLVLPTALGCGECMFSLSILGEARPTDGGSLNVLVLDIYQPDQPEYWESYADYFGNPDYAWSVLDTLTFMTDYEIFGLGAFLVIDPEGKLVFRSDAPPRMEYITHMFTLTERQGVD